MCRAFYIRANLSLSLFFIECVKKKLRVGCNFIRDLFERNLDQIKQTPVCVFDAGALLQFLI